MISAFYKHSPLKKQKITRIRQTQQAFIIPKQHLIDNQSDLTRLKKQYEEYQRQFTFIKDQLERQVRLKKEKSKDTFRLDRSQLESALQFRSQNQNRQDRRREIGITQRQLEKLEEKKEKKWTNSDHITKRKQMEQISVTSVGIIRKINNNYLVR